MLLPRRVLSEDKGEGTEALESRHCTGSAPAHEEPTRGQAPEVQALGRGARGECADGRGRPAAPLMRPAEDEPGRRQHPADAVCQGRSTETLQLESPRKQCAEPEAARASQPGAALAAPPREPRGGERVRGGGLGWGAP